MSRYKLNDNDSLPPDPEKDFIGFTRWQVKQIKQLQKELAVEKTGSVIMTHDVKCEVVINANNKLVIRITFSTDDNKINILRKWCEFMSNQKAEEAYRADRRNLENGRNKEAIITPKRIGEMPKYYMSKPLKWVEYIPRHKGVKERWIADVFHGMFFALNLTDSRWEATFNHRSEYDIITHAMQEQPFNKAAAQAACQEYLEDEILAGMATAI